MASKIEGRDRNGMRAANWSQPNLAAIQSVKVGEKCSNAELFEAIKQIVCESVIALRGTKEDEKYRNIVDMLMLRVRGALANTIEQLEDSTVDVDTSKIAENVANAATDLIKDKIDPKNGLVLIDKDNLKELVDTIVEAIAVKSQPTKEDTQKEEASVETDKTVIVEKTIEKTTEKPTEKPIEKPETQPIENTKAQTVNPQTSSIDVSQSISLDDINKLQTELDKNFKKIESLIQSTTVDKSKQNETQTPVEKETQTRVEKVETTITQKIVVVEKAAEDSNKKLEQKTTPIPKVEEKAEQQPKGGSKAKDVLTGRQFTELLKMLTKCQTAMVNLIGVAIEKTDKQFEKLNEQLQKIWDHLNKSKISWLAILAGISLFLLPLFWDKIKGFFSWINTKFNISGIIENFIKSIDWGKYVGMVTGFIWDAVKKKFNEFIQNPMDWIVNKFKTAYTALTTWTKDIWEWIKGKLSWTKQKQDENEAKAEKESTEKFQAAMDNLEQHTNANVQQVQESTNVACAETETNVAQKSEDIHTQVEEMQQNANEQITATTDAVQQNTDNINNVVLPGMSNDIEKSIDGAGQKVEGRADTAITASENKLNGAINDLDKKIDQNGAPTSVSKETLAKMDSEGEGASIGKGGIDQKVEGPKTVVQTTTEQQGKTVTLYAKKNDVDRAARENKEVNNLVGNVAANGPNVTNLNIEGNSTQANIQNKILVNGTGNPAEKEAKTYEDMHITVNEVSKNSATIEDGLNKNQTLLGSLKEKVNDYFGELNGLVKALKEKPPAQNNNNVIVMDSGKNGASHNSAQMETF